MLVQPDAIVADPPWRVSTSGTVERVRLRHEERRRYEQLEARTYVPSRRCGPLIMLLVLLVLQSAAFGMHARLDPETGRIRVLHMGDGLWGSKPGLLLSSDPKIDLTMVPIITVWYTPEEIARYIRLYMPRNFDDLVNGDDLILLGDCDASAVSSRWQIAFKQAVDEEGLGLLMTGGHRGFGGGSAQQGQWESTVVEQEVLPVLVFTQESINGPIRMCVVAKGNPLMTSLPWGTAPILGGLNKASIKEGAGLLADDGSKAQYPVLAYWDTGAGRSTVFLSDIHGASDGTEVWTTDWVYWTDFLLNLAYYSTGVDVPQNPVEVHLIRSELQTYQSRVALLGDLMNFVARFGANPAEIEHNLALVKEAKKEADGLYLRQEYQEALKSLREVTDQLSQLDAQAVKMGERALLWVYLTEWLTVTGASIATGVLVWSLMIKRRLYRQVGTTRSV